MIIIIQSDLGDVARSQTDFVWVREQSNMDDLDEPWGLLVSYEDERMKEGDERIPLAGRTVTIGRGKGNLHKAISAIDIHNPLSSKTPRFHLLTTSLYPPHIALL